MTSQLPPYFSVIIPALNEDQFLPHLLKNLNAQSFRDFEVAVVDGYSEDNTAGLVASFPAKYPLKLISTKKRNVAYQRNLGARRAKGRILVFFDADTQIPKNFLEVLHTTFEVKHPHFVTAYMNADSNKPSEILFTAMSNLLMEISRIVKTPAAYGAMQAIKKTTFEDVGGYDDTIKFAEDSHLFQKAQNYNYKFLIISRPAYIFSLRRLRAEGLVEVFYQYLKLNLTIALKGHHADNLVYEMGGARYKNLNQPQFTRRFDLVFKRIRQRTQTQSSKIKMFIDRFSQF